MKRDLRELPICQKKFFERSTEIVAKDLLGAILVKIEENEILSGRIVEVEAYFGPGDPGSHAKNGPTKRSVVMFGPAGCAYVYFCYGMHYLFNVVTEEEGKAGAVLIRAAKPLTGMEIMKRRRNVHDLRKLLSGPARLTQAFGIDLSFNTLPLTKENGLYIVKDEYIVRKIGTSARVGIPRVEGDEFRFFIEGLEFIS